MMITLTSPLESAAGSHALHTSSPASFFKTRITLIVWVLCTSTDQGHACRCASSQSLPWVKGLLRLAHSTSPLKSAYEIVMTSLAASERLLPPSPFSINALLFLFRCSRKNPEIIRKHGHEMVGPDLPVVAGGSAAWALREGAVHRASGPTEPPLWNEEGCRSGCSSWTHSEGLNPKMFGSVHSRMALHHHSL